MEDEHEDYLTVEVSKLPRRLTQNGCEICEASKTRADTCQSLHCSAEDRADKREIVFFHKDRYALMRLRGEI